MKREVFFDIETQKLFNEITSDDPRDLGVSVVSVYTRSVDNGEFGEGQMRSFWESDLGGLWQIFESADRIIGFNTINFDVPVLRRYAPFDIGVLPHFDILEKFRQKIGHRVSLNVLARDTLGMSKTDIGTNAVSYWKKGDPESLAKLRMYCESDVEITRKLYDFARIHGVLKFNDKWNTVQTVTLDFSYPTIEKTSDDSQLGLF